MEHNRNKQKWEEKQIFFFCATSVTKDTANIITERNSPEEKVPCIFSDNL